MAQESRKHDKEDTGCEPPEGPSLCANSCGFFGSKDTMNLCSKCYRDVVVRRANTAAEKANTNLDLHGDGVVQEAPASSSVNTPDAGKVSSGVLEKPTASGTPTRCLSCKKRVGLTGFKCRCGNTFCSLHRYSDKHHCTVDYKAMGREAISEANPTVKAEKIEKL